MEWLVAWLADGHICVIMPALFQFLGENSFIKNWAGLGADSGSDFIVAVLVKLMWLLDHNDDDVDGFQMRIACRYLIVTIYYFSSLKSVQLETSTIWHINCW